MRRKTIKDLALVTAAAGVLAFEVASLQAALPAATRALADQGVVSQVTSASREAGAAVFQLAMGAVKESARRFGTVTPPAVAKRPSLVAAGEAPAPLADRQAPARLAAAKPARPAGKAACAPKQDLSAVRHLHVHAPAAPRREPAVRVALERAHELVAEARAGAATLETLRTRVTVVATDGATRTFCIERRGEEASASF